MDQGIMSFINLIPKDFYIIVGALYVIGMMIKKSELIPDKFILFILLALGIIFAIFKGGFNVDSILYGIILSAAPVYINNFIKQGTEIVTKK